MTIRRYRHVFVAVDASDASAILADDTATTVVSSGIPHPASTNFGPAGLGQFVRELVNGNTAVLNETSDKPNKGKSRAIDVPPARPSDDPNQTSWTPERVAEVNSMLHVLHNTTPSSRVTLAPNTLVHLHGVTVQETTEAASFSPSTIASTPPSLKKRSTGPSGSARRKVAKRSVGDDEQRPGNLGSPERQSSRRAANANSPRRGRTVPQRRSSAVPPTSLLTEALNQGSTSPGSHKEPSIASLNLDTSRVEGRLFEFNYAAIVPFDTPAITVEGGRSTATASNSRPSRRAGSARATRSRVGALRGSRSGGRRRRGRRSPAIPEESNSASDEEYREEDSDDDEDSSAVPSRRISIDVDPGHRSWRPRDPRPDDPTSGPTPSSELCFSLSEDVWNEICRHLSLGDVNNLRCTCSTLAHRIASERFKSIVAPFDLNLPALGAHSDTSVTSRYGESILRFGITFEVDPVGLAFAPAQILVGKQHAWHGSFDWPLPQYHGFEHFQKLEELVDPSSTCLNHLMEGLAKTSELAFAIDSGHGWLNGPDISDMALFDLRQKQGTKVFGQNFPAENIWDAFGRNQYFQWAQHNSINTAMIELAGRRPSSNIVKILTTIGRMQVRERESFRVVENQPDFDAESHTAGPAPGHNAASAILPPLMGPPVGLAQQALQTLAAHANQQHMHQRAPPTLNGNRITSENTQSIPLQWPLIFNGYNLAAETGGTLTSVRERIADPQSFPVLPGCLTEDQARWLMETCWAQRSFLSSFTNAIFVNKDKLRGIMSLNIAKINSGHLGALHQPQFWSSLPGLRRLKLLVIPDWRQEHTSNAVYQADSLLISPLIAVEKFTALLNEYVCNLEHLYSATLGWVGGGEHAVGIKARNRHVLPAPIIDVPRNWISDHDPTYSRAGQRMLKFDHIRQLTFVNCWFSPIMLESFMEKSRDTSLRTLTLDSVSMTVRHREPMADAMSTIGDNLYCRYNKDAWLYETVPESATWTKVLDKITPGLTIAERRYDASLGGADEERPKPQRKFRGHIQKIELKSCGYASIEGIPASKFCQADLVWPPTHRGDVGLTWRASQLSNRVIRMSNDAKEAEEIAAKYGFPRDPAEKNERAVTLGHVMLPAQAGLGRLTQCIHPVEKRILEEAWGMRFGWGDCLERWAAVEDGELEGGTGRFSGTISAAGSSATTTADDGVMNSLH
jgi:hypothetical protein